MSKPEIKSFFFTFGTDPRYPFQGGWVEIEAPSRGAACDMFRAYFPDRTEGILNCAFVYSDEFKTTGMYKGDYPDEFCHAKIRYLTENDLTEEKDA